MSKSVQQFECRDDIWKRVVTLAERRGIATDDVVQAALVQLFKRKKTASPVQDSAPRASSDAGPLSAPTSGTKHTPAVPSPKRRVPTGRVQPARPATATPENGTPRAKTRPSSVAPGRGLPKPGGRPAAPQAPPNPTPDQIPPLYLFCEGQWHTIDSDQFVIGRGSKFSDLPIKDANISRRHCAVVRRNGGYFIKDLGSTNGIEFNGERVDDHQVNDGAVYFLCDHELRFSFASPF